MPPRPSPVSLELCCDLPGGPYLQLSDETRSEPELQPLDARILGTLRSANGPQRTDELRARLRVRMQSLVDNRIW